MMKSIYIAAVIGILGLACVTGPARAEEGEIQLETVKVIAEKREEDVQKVAIPISVLTRADIEDRDVTELADLAGAIPNLQFLRSGRPDGGSFNFRGLGMFGMSVLSEKSPVVVYYDGIPWDGRFGLETDFGNIERIEFLRGPQGTLYGKNAMAGVLNIVTKDPGNEPMGKVSTHYEARDGKGASFQFQTPLVEDILFAYVSASANSAKGWMTDHTPGGERNWDKQEDRHLFMKGILKSAKKLDVSLQYSFDDAESGNAPYIVGRDITYDVTTGFTDPEFNSTTHNGALKVDYEADGFTVTSISTFKSMHTDSHQYFGYADSAGFDDIDKINLSEEFRLASADSGKEGGVQWLLGTFLSYETMERNNTGYYFTTDVYNYPTTIDSKSYSLFGELTVPLFIDGLSATAGARYEIVEKRMNQRYENYDSSTGVFATAPTEYGITDSWNNILGKFALEYEASPKAMLYASVAQGYSPGGFNYLESDPEYATFDEQRSVDYELGLKARLFDNRLMLNPNVFYSEYEDLQISEEASPMKFVVVNAGKAHATGVELDFTARPIRPLTIYGSAAVTKAVYDDYEENLGAGTVDYGGNTITNTPVYTANLGLVYRHESGFFGMVDYQRLGKTYLSKDNSENFERDAFGLVNTKIGWEDDSGLEAYLYVRNLLDEEYFTEVSEEYNIFMVGEPRTLGVRLSYRF